MTANAFATLDDFEAFLQQHLDVDSIDAMFPDLCGVNRGKRLTLDLARQLFRGGLQIPASMLLLSVSGSCMDPAGMGVSDGDPDVLIRPLAGTLQVLPWAKQERAQVMVSFMNAEGEANALEPRQLLTQVVAQFKALGLHPVVACELEFCLIDRARGSDGGPRRPESPVAGRRHASTQLMSLSYIDDFADYVADVTSACRDLSIPMTALNAEYGGDQFEINLRHVDDAVASADHAILLKQVVQRVAVEHDIRATFMAKPYPDTAGSGMHWHVSLLDDGGKNVFDDGGEAGSEILQNAVAGVLQTMHESMAFYAPNINSYRRFKPGLFVPMTRSWGYNNRSVAVRIPGGAPHDRRMEFRVPGADANPYLALSALLAGMHYGVKASLRPPAVIEGNAGESLDDTLPLRLHDALRELAGAKTLPTYLGGDYCSVYADCKRLELDAFLDVPTEREFSWYLRPEL
jgi:glutamine synthetase